MPPPPRRPHTSSRFSSPPAPTTLPSEGTTPAPMRVLPVRACRAGRGPMPPPRAREGFGGGGPGGGVGGPGPPAERNPGAAGGADDASGREEAVRLRRGVEIEPPGAAVSAGDTRGRVDVDGAHQRQIDPQPA